MNSHLLLENALDFFVEALFYLRGDRPFESRDYKYSILHTASCAELLLKQRLYDEHWSFVFSDIDKAKEQDFETGNFRSVDFGTALGRVESLCDVEITSTHKKVLSDLRNIRNRIQHQHYQINHDQAKSVMVRVWSFINDFIVQDMLPDNVSATSDLINAIREGIGQQEEYVKARTAEIAPNIQAYVALGGTVLDCQTCQQEAVLIEGGEVRCLFCGLYLEWERFADLWLTDHAGYEWTDPKERYSNPVLTECPECDMESLYHDRSDEGNMYPSGRSWICFYCGVSYGEGAIDNCMKCNRTFLKGDENSPFCERCWRS